MIERNNKKKFIFYPENVFKNIWDVFMTFVLIFSCIIIPLKLACPDLFADPIDESDALTFTTKFAAHFSNWDIGLYLIDGLFLIDIIFSFNQAYDDEDFKIHDSYHEIAIKYLEGWFLIDVFAIIPFDLIIEGGLSNTQKGGGSN